MLNSYKTRQEKFTGDIAHRNRLKQSITFGPSGTTFLVFLFDSTRLSKRNTRSEDESLPTDDSISVLPPHTLITIPVADSISVHSDSDPSRADGDCADVLVLMMIALVRLQESDCRLSMMSCYLYYHIRVSPKLMVPLTAA